MPLSVYPINFSKTIKLLESENKAFDNQDAEEFYNRIKTFVDQQKWVGKPSSLAPPVCAHYGWKCINPNLLQCVSCSAILCTSLPPMEKCKSYNACLVEIIKSLKSAHKKHCPWPLAPSPDCFFKMVSVHKGVVFQEFVTRLESLLSIKSLLPLIRPETVEIIAISDDCFESLCKLNHIPVNSISKSAILLAATGWKKKPEVCERKFIVCHNCQRSVGLWFYAPLETIPEVNCSPEKHVFGNVCNNETETDLSSDAEHDSMNVVEGTKISENVLCADSELQDSQRDSEERPTKKQKISVENKEPFDPLYEHRPWCLWLSKTDNIGSNGEDVTGWKMFLTSLLKNLESDTLSPCDFLSPSQEDLNSARELMKTWSNPL